MFTVAKTGELPE